MNNGNKIDMYTIPPNFAEEGTVFSGRMKTRNAVETAVILCGLLPLLYSLNVSGKAKIYIGLIVVLPVVILAVIGIQGESLFTFVAGFFRFLKCRRRLAPPDGRYRLEQERRKRKAERGKEGNKSGRRGEEAEETLETKTAPDEKEPSGRRKENKAEAGKEIWWRRKKRKGPAAGKL